MGHADQTDIHEQLAQRLDELPVPFPRTQTGSELALLRHMFSPGEAAIALHLSAVAEPVETIFRRYSGGSTPRSDLPKDIETLQTQLDSLARRGSINSGITIQRGRRVRTYGLAPLVVGMFEFQVDKLTPEYVEDFQRYLDEGFRASVVGNRTAQLRTVPVGHALAGSRSVGTYTDIRAYIRGSDGPFGVINCVCRQSSMMRGIDCPNSSTLETCLMLGNAAENDTVLGPVRKLSKDEVLEILDRAEQEGHVIQPQNAQKPAFICCCDRDGCEVLQNARKLPRPAEAVATTHRAEISATACIGCGACIRRCPMDALSLRAAARPPAHSPAGPLAVVDADRCIGCGLCTSACPTEAITLSRLPGAKAPPRTPTGMYLRMYRDRFGIGFLVKTALRKLLGKKI